MWPDDSPVRFFAHTWRYLFLVASICCLLIAGAVLWKSTQDEGTNPKLVTIPTKLLPVQPTTSIDDPWSRVSVVSEEVMTVHVYTERSEAIPTMTRTCAKWEYPDRTEYVCRHPDGSVSDKTTTK